MNYVVTAAIKLTKPPAAPAIATCPWRMNGACRSAAIYGAIIFVLCHVLPVIAASMACKIAPCVSKPSGAM